MKKSWLPAGLQIAFIYFLFGSLWILFSDLILESLVHDVRELSRLQSYKGWFFVAASAILIFILLDRYIRQQKRIKIQLEESEERLLLAISISNQGIYDLDIPSGKISLDQNIQNESRGLQLPRFMTLDELLTRIHPDERELVEKTYQDCVKGKSTQFIVEFRNKIRSDEWRWVRLIGSIVEKSSKGKPLRLLGTYMDITEKKKDELLRIKLLEDARRRLERITTLHEIDQEISSTSDLPTTLRKIVINVKNHLGVDAVSVLLLDETTDVFTYADSIGFETDRIKNARVKMGGSFAGIAAQENKLVHFHKLDDDSVDEAFASLLEEAQIKNYLGMPLSAKGVLVGVLELFVKKDIQPDDEWLGFLETLAGQAALAIENARLMDGLENANQDLQIVNADLIQANQNLIVAYDATIESLALALNLRDYETEDHSRRVTTMMKDLAGMMDFSPEDLVSINRGTLLHDIGKLGVPDAILRKPGILSDEERQVMQQHTVYAYDLLKTIEYLKPALDIPFLHHERWDGSGYPNGLAGQQIPLPARIFAVVDVFDALTSDRPYRKAWSKEAALTYIKEQSGKHFDPEVVEIFLSYLSKHSEIY